VPAQIGAADDELVDIAGLRVRREKELARACRRLTGELGVAWAAVLARRPGPVVDEHFEHHDKGFLQAVARHLADVASAKTALSAPAHRRIRSSSLPPARTAPATSAPSARRS
jgi:hypothetical protein